MRLQEQAPVTFKLTTMLFELLHESDSSFIKCTREMLNEMEFINDNLDMRKKTLNQADVRSVHINHNIFLREYVLPLDIV